MTETKYGVIKGYEQQPTIPAGIAAQLQRGDPLY